MPESIKFTMGYVALKLLGKQMYSNIGSALSELIANGIDAGAKNIGVYIDMSKKASSLIEIADDGSGMSTEDLENKYAHIGFNKRKNQPNAMPMGRKGVGKLAALYLTNKYIIYTGCSSDDMKSWLVDFEEENREESEGGGEERPALKPIQSEPLILQNIPDEAGHGTVVRLLNVDLTRIGESFFDGLTINMSNFFLYEELRETEISFYIKKDEKTTIEEALSQPRKADKKIGFGNMLSIVADSEKLSQLPKTNYRYFDVRASGYGESAQPVHESMRQSFEEIDSESKGVFEGRDYALKGWIGIHSTINQDKAKQNDEQFTKTRYYQPTKLRLYLRNKLAVADFLPYLRNTQEGINYIEGEISFDLLDDDKFADITTTNRQDVDIHDARVQKLIGIVNKIVSRLIKDRNEKIDSIKKKNAEVETKIQADAKTNALTTIKSNFEARGYSGEKLNEAISTVANLIKGPQPPELKNIYKIFISHSRADRRFTDFIFNVLCKQGAVPEDFFYTSVGNPAESNLANNIKSTIAESSTLVLFMDSRNFVKSQFCMFEGGAFWATRSVEDCAHIAIQFSDIPEYINDRNKYHVTLSQEDEVGKEIFDLTREKYKEIVSLLNLLIDHLNKSAIHASSQIPLFPEPNFPDEVELIRQEKKIEDFFDPIVKEYWQTYVQRFRNGEGETPEDYLNTLKK